MGTEDTDPDHRQGSDFQHRDGDGTGEKNNDSMDEGAANTDPDHRPGDFGGTKQYRDADGASEKSNDRMDESRKEPLAAWELHKKREPTAANTTMKEARDLARQWDKEDKEAKAEARAARIANKGNKQQQQQQQQDRVPVAVGAIHKDGGSRSANHDKSGLRNSTVRSSHNSSVGTVQEERRGTPDAKYGLHRPRCTYTAPDTIPAIATFPAPGPKQLRGLRKNSPPNAPEPASEPEIPVGAEFVAQATEEAPSATPTPTTVTWEHGLSALENPQLAQASLVEAHASLPVAVPQNQDQSNNRNSKKGILWFLALACALGVLAFVMLVVTVWIPRKQGNQITSKKEEDPTAHPEYQQAKSLIIQEFGQDYFDNNQKEEALHWMVFEDPLSLGNLTDLNQFVQRFSLVSFYLQANHLNPWSNCTRPVTQEQHHYPICHFGENMAMRWLSGTHECQWMGIFCQSGTVSQIIFLYDIALAGPIPKEFAKLRNLSSMVLIDNNLSGTLPGWLSDLPLLSSLDLSGNRLTGTIPPWLFSITSMQDLILGSNRLTGVIPTEVRIFNSVLISLELGVNSLSGTIPPWLFSITSMQDLFLGSNRLTGVIPTEVGIFKGYGLSLENNLLTSSIPEEMYSLSNLFWLDLDTNDLTGSLPTGIGHLSGLFSLSLENCGGFGGSIPSEIGLLKGLEELCLENTSIRGTIPEELFSLRNLTAICLSRTQISGTISTNIGLLTSLVQLHLSNTQISGTIPKELGVLASHGDSKYTELLLNGNSKLSGSMPESLCSKQFLFANTRYYTNFVVDCTPSQSSGTPAVYCPESCCTTCCDVETNICTDN